MKDVQKIKIQLNTLLYDFMMTLKNHLKASLIRSRLFIEEENFEFQKWKTTQNLLTY